MDVLDDGDQGRIADLFRRASRALAAHATVLMGGDCNQAQDLVQASFQALVEQWKRLRDLDMELQRAWLWRVAANKAVDAYRRQSHVVPIDPLLAGIEVSRSILSVEPVVLARELLDACWEVVRNMPPQRRLVIVLHIYGESTAEIASRLGISAATVRGHRAVAMQELAAALGPQFTIHDPCDSDGEEHA